VQYYGLISYVDRMLMGDELAGMWLGEEGDISAIMEVSNEFNYVTPSKCFVILMGDYTDGKRLLGRFSNRDLHTCTCTATQNFVEILPSEGMCPLSPLHQNLSDFLGDKKVLCLTPLPPSPNT
jgi:hypothetical protein